MSVNSSGPDGVINQGSRTLWVWCLISRLLVSATFLEVLTKIPTMPAPWATRLVARPCWREGTLRWMRRRAIWRYSRSSFGLVFWLSRQLSPNLTHWRDGPTHQEWPQDQVRPRGQAPARSYPNRQKTGLSSGLPGRQQQLRKPGDSGEGRHCDSLWMILSAWLLIEQSKRNFSFWKLQNQFFLHMQLKIANLLKSLHRKKLEVNPFHVLEIHSQLCLRPQPWQTKTSSEKQKRGPRDILNLKQKTIRSLSVCLYGFMYLSVLVFSDNIVEVVNEF